MFDLLVAKKWALKYAVNAACTILRVRSLSITRIAIVLIVFRVTQVDQIIMAKRAGGPKPRDTSGGMDQDDD